MEKEKNILDELMNRQPFRVPEGYFEGFTDDFMSRLPEKPVTIESNKISLFERAKPYLYLAAMFVGAMIFFNIIGNKKDSATDGKNDNTSNVNLLSSLNTAIGESEDADFLEFIKEEYANNAISYMDNFLDR